MGPHADPVEVERKVEALSQLAEEFFELSLSAEPFSATVLGFRQYDAEIPDVTEEGHARLRGRFAEIRDRAAAMAQAGLDGEDEVTRAMLETMAGDAVETLDARGVEFAVTPFWFGAQAQVLTWLPKAQLETADQAAAYLERCRRIPRYLSDSAERLRAGVTRGLVPVASGASGSVQQVAEYLALPLADDLVLAPFRASETGRALLAQAEQVVADEVRPAMAAFSDVLRDEIAPHARPDDKPGLCWLPDGERRYAALRREHLSTAHTAEELHRIGLEQIARLDEEYRELGATVLGTSDLQEIYRRLREDPELRYSDPEHVVRDATQAIDRARAVLPEWFGRLPEAPCEVRAIPEMEAKGSAIAYYTPPPETGGPGVYWINTTDSASIFEAEAVAFHEALPGHHLQLALAQELRSLPNFRRYGGVTAYAEGWGLYTERLADEMGLYSSDLMRIGMLSLDSLRAGRLVLDTGLHALGWSRERAIRFMVDNSPLDETVVSNEVERYISYPGQALAYMVGRLEILRLRQQARDALGPRFDIRAFHDVVLGSGAVPLTVLDGMVGRWAGQVAGS